MSVDRIVGGFSASPMGEGSRGAIVVKDVVDGLTSESDGAAEK
jgi:hypothetical protein